MRVPNWKHRSKKEKKRKLKPQALRAARDRRRHLINCLLNRPNKAVSSYVGYIQEDTDGSKEGNQITSCSTFGN